VASRLYLRRGEELVPLSAEPFKLEDLLQALVEKYPSLVAGDTAEDEKRRWLCVTREAPVGDSGESPGRWSLDHLVVNDLAVPTLVEAKRASNTEVRRQVVGQMFEYAANASAYWDVAAFRESWEVSVREGGGDPDARLATELGVEEPDVFWQKVDENLRAGQIRLVFVADGVPRELQRIVEFLNERMVPTEVLAVDIRQHPAGDDVVLIRTVLGQTVAAIDRKQKRSWPPSTVEELREGLGGLPEPARTAGLKIFEHLAQTARPVPSRGETRGMYFHYEAAGRLVLTIDFWLEWPKPDDTTFRVPFSSMRYDGVPPVQLEAIWQRFSQVPSLAPLLAGVPEADYQKLPRILVRGVLDQEGVADEFCKAIDDVVRGAGQDGDVGADTV
jgi:hypothetical protein